MQNTLTLIQWSPKSHPIIATVQNSKILSSKSSKSDVDEALGMLYYVQLFGYNSLLSMHPWNWGDKLSAPNTPNMQWCDKQDNSYRLSSSKGGTWKVKRSHRSNVVLKSRWANCTWRTLIRLQGLGVIFHVPQPCHLTSQLPPLHSSFPSSVIFLFPRWVVL